MKQLLPILLCLPFIGFGQISRSVEMKGMLEAHNKFRSEIGVNKLEWSNRLAKNALKWANILKKKCSNNLKHSPKKYRKGFGENLALYINQTVEASDVVEYWATEKECFNFATKKCVNNCLCGHYTQIIWRNTTEVGCAVVQCEDKQIWVCQYSPAGNWVGEEVY